MSYNASTILDDGFDRTRSGVKAVAPLHRVDTGTRRAAVRRQEVSVTDELTRIVLGIGPKVRSLRKQAGLSLQQLAEQADVSAAAIHKIEQSGMVPTITTLLKVAGALGQPVAYFVDEEEAVRADGPHARRRAAADLHLAHRHRPRRYHRDVRPVQHRRRPRHRRPGRQQR